MDFLVHLVALVGITLILNVLYRWALPKPLAGIPYYQPSSERLLGDIPDAIKEPAQILKFLGRRCQELGSIYQVWMQPFARPWVIISDYAQAEDILCRRVREFDRAPFHLGFVVSLLPDACGAMKTHDPRFARGKRLVGDTMSNTFLHDIAGPTIRTQVFKLVGLWNQKMRLALGRPIDARQDIQLLSVDVGWALAYGEDIHACDAQIDMLSQLSSIMLPSGDNETIVMPEAALSAEYKALCLLSESAGIAIATPLGSYGHYLALKLVPKYRNAVAVKEKYVKASLLAAYSRMKDVSAGDRPRRAVDMIMKREMQSAEKEGRAVDPISRELFDESFGFVLGGVDTSTAVMTWGLKYLTHHQDVQRRLRESLIAAFPGETHSALQLDPRSLDGARIPYLDAFSEEVLRHCSISVVITRVATVDCQIQGHFIPKGTQIFFPGDICTRPSSTPDVKLKEGHSPLSIFDPERWLRRSPTGDIQYDPSAAPMHSFDAGPRGCFGKKLAYLTLKLFYAYIVWNFELLTTPTSASFEGHDAMGHLPNLLEIRLRSAGIVKQAI